jgi:hypothetical protein
MEPLQHFLNFTARDRRFRVFLLQGDRGITMCDLTKYVGVASRPRYGCCSKSLSLVMLDLARNPLEKIGSFTVYDSGEISLSNRPLTLRRFWLATGAFSASFLRERKRILRRKSTASFFNAQGKRRWTAVEPEQLEEERIRLSLLLTISKMIGRGRSS